MTICCIPLFHPKNEGKVERKEGREEGRREGGKGGRDEDPEIFTFLISLLPESSSTFEGRSGILKLKILCDSYKVDVV